MEERKLEKEESKRRQTEVREKVRSQMLKFLSDQREQHWVTLLQIQGASRFSTPTRKAFSSPPRAMKPPLAKNPFEKLNYV